MKKHIQIFLICSMLPAVSFAQCPPNIDFENGDFQNWKLWLGNVTAGGGISLSELPGPSPERQTMLSRVTDGSAVDYFGNFPVVCPNGSNHSIRLGNTGGGAQAEGVSYDFTIPAGQNLFSLTYYYAVVFQDPGHAPQEQPRLQIEITNVTDGEQIGCSSFSFIASGGLPGFFQSASSVGNVPVWCKNWSANSVKLDGLAGKTIRLFFKTSDCTYSAHFGYAYIDVDAQCGSSFIGAKYCAADPEIDVKAPFGYDTYKWFNSDFSQVLGFGQILHIAPAPPAGTTVKVAVTPFAGYGCPDTLTANLTADLNVNADAGPDKALCDVESVQLGILPEPTLVYHWIPEAGLTNPNISNPFSNASASTTYTVTVSSPGGGCTNTDEVSVIRPVLDNTIEVTGELTYCEGNGQNTVLSIDAADSIQWYQNGAAVIGAQQPQFTVTQTGDYYVSTFSDLGCMKTSAIQHVDVYPQPDASFEVIRGMSLCSPTDTFHFKNLSSIREGTLQYLWDFGDGSGSTEFSPDHSYLTPGTYVVKLVTNAIGGCVSDTSISVVVKAGVKTDFTAANICINLDLPLVNNSTASGASGINYLWDFGNGQTSSVRNPVYRYPAPGNYTIVLTASTPECPEARTKSVNVVITAPAAAQRYADRLAIINFPEQLEARAIGQSARWNPRLNLDNAGSYTPYFKGADPQLYNITLTTKDGCVTVDTVLVKTYKKIKINVPTGFTPDGDGKNDYLRPILFGFKKVNYFRVYNRQGQLLYQSESETPGWNGKINGVDQNTQTVIWVLEAEDVDGKVHFEKGTSVLVR